MECISTPKQSKARSITTRLSSTIMYDFTPDLLESKIQNACLNTQICYWVNYFFFFLYFFFLSSKGFRLQFLVCPRNQDVKLLLVENLFSNIQIFQYYIFYNYNYRPETLMSYFFSQSYRSYILPLLQILVIMITSLQQYSKKCKKEEHNNEPIVLICLNKNCSQNLLCCVNCIDEQHSKHQVISLRKFQKTIGGQLQKNNNNKRKDKISKLFSDYQSKFINSLKQLENDLISKIQMIQNQVTIIFSQIHKILNIPSHQQVVEQLMNSQNVKDWADVLQLLRINQKYKIGASSDTAVILAHQHKTFKNSIKKFNIELNSKIDLIRTQVKNLNLCSFRYEDPPIFHQIYRYTDMSIQDNQGIIQKKKNNGSRTIALGNRPLDPINNSVKFKIIKNGDGIPSICIGVAILSIVKQNNFMNCTGHKRGVYCIDQAMTSSWGSVQQSNEATVWNHDLNMSNSTIGFQFGEGDIITMTLDFEDQFLIFQLGDEMYDMEINAKLKDLYPFVSLSNTNSVVEILQ